jgi:hypothetical protein
MSLAILMSVTNIVDQPLVFGLELVWWTVAFSAALLVFINIQTYYNDPHRKEYEKEWYEQFIAVQQKRYLDTDIDWRAKDLGLHFGYQFTDKETIDEWRDSDMSIWPHKRDSQAPSDS